MKGCPMLRWVRGIEVVLTAIVLSLLLTIFVDLFFVTYRAQDGIKHRCCDDEAE